MKLRGRLENKPWGQRRVPHAAGTKLADAQIGEVIFEGLASANHPVMIKYLYTSERLSIQVHPDDFQARRTGHESGKDEMWIVLSAQPGATIGIGLRRKATTKEVAAAIADGSIVDLIDWRPVKQGDVIYNRAGTIHAVGAGLVLLEVQHAIDLTYRLYDYGRQRELHLEQGLAVSRFEPHFDERDCRLVEGESKLLATGPYFGAAWCAGAIPAGVPLHARDIQLVVISGAVTVEGRAVSTGEAAIVPSLDDVDLTSATVVLAWPTPKALTRAA